MYDAASLYWWQTLAILTYMCGSWFSSSFVSVFVIATVLLAMDFWTVKNVSGRLMVGLRWWSEVIEDGSTIWRFEAHEVRDASPATPPSIRDSTAQHSLHMCHLLWSSPSYYVVRPHLQVPALSSHTAYPCPLLSLSQGNLQSTSLDIAIFWVGLFVPAVVWVFFGVGLILRLSFDWLLLVTVALTLNFANIIGYVRCKKGEPAQTASQCSGRTLSRQYYGLYQDVQQLDCARYRGESVQCTSSVPLFPLHCRPSRTATPYRDRQCLRRCE